MVESLDGHVEDQGTPDVVLMDIEGWEYEVLPASPGLLSTRPVIVLEVHTESGWIDGEVNRPEGGVESVSSPGKVDPEELMELLESNGYETTEIARRRRTNYHVVAVPSERT